MAGLGISLEARQSDASVSRQQGPAGFVLAQVAFQSVVILAAVIIKNIPEQKETDRQTTGTHYELNGILPQ